MIKDKTQKQESGDNSANYQAETINQYGISYRDAKEIALDVFQQNFIVLSEQAKQLAKERAEELTNNFLTEIKEKNPELLNSVQEPSMQSALYSAQKSYAISGDRDSADLLVDILVKRAEQNERNLMQIVLNECLEIIPKLIIRQLNTLSLVFLVRNLSKDGMTESSLRGFIINVLKPFTENLTKEPSFYLHLQCSYCCVGLGNDHVLTLGSFQIDKTFSALDKDILLNYGDFMEELFDVWKNSEMGEMMLTPAGIALALANIKRVTGISYNLAHWIR
jgi:hypothetical protein